MKPNATGYTTLPSILETIPKRIYLFKDEQHLFIAVHRIITSFVVDGISRVGDNENNVAVLGQATIRTKINAPPIPGNNNGGQDGPCYWELSSDTQENMLEDPLDGTVKMGPVPSLVPEMCTTCKFYVTLRGHGIIATSTAYYLALTTLRAKLGNRSPIFSFSVGIHRLLRTS